MEILSWETDSRRNEKKQPSRTAALSHTKKKQEKAAAKKKIHQNNQARNYELPETSQIWESRKRDELQNAK
jgi:hypothetical protein